ncbi:TetR/AcrR family transcriptional regulator, partial [Desulfobacterales bacterium HSG16]|nr:TetR/AcrR family transcriptional regulator [Desulfobacterales bacterium HSG16]
DAIHTEVRGGVDEALARTGNGRDVLTEVIREYFLVCHRWCDHILLIYQETQSLPSQWRKRVLENEINITGIFIKVLADMVAIGKLPNIDSQAIELVAHDITVLGHMWTFRRWYLARHYNIEDYIRLQTDFILGKYTYKICDESTSEET